MLRASLRDQDDIIVGTIRSLIGLGNECHRRLEAGGGPMKKRPRETAGAEAEAEKMSQASNSGVRSCDCVFVLGRGEESVKMKMEGRALIAHRGVEGWLC